MSERISFTLATVGLGLLFAAAVLLPHALQRVDTQYPFQGIEIMGADGELYYAARVREVSDGFLFVGNPYYADLKEMQTVQPPLAEWAIVIIGRVLGLGPIGAFVLCKGLFAFLLTLVMVGAFSSITGMPWLSLLAVCVLLFANALLNAPWDLPAILRGELSPGYLRFARPVNPQWPALWFFLTLWLLSFWLRNRKVSLSIAAALTTLVMLYSYVYAWTYMAVISGLLLLYFFFRRDRVRQRDLLLYAAICLLGGMPYFWHVWSVMHHPWYAETAMRMGVIASRHVMFGAWILLFLPLSIFTRSVWPKTWPLLPAIAFGGLLVLNQQVLTGSSLVPHHYHWYFIQPCASIIFLTILFFLLRRFLVPPLSTLIFALTVLFSVAFGFAQQLEIYHQQRVQWGTLQSASGLFAFLRQHTKPGIVVTGVAEGFIDEYVPVYTSADSYATPYANLFLVSRSRAQDAFFFRLWMRGITPQEADRRLPTDLRTDLSSALHAIYYREFTGDMRAIPDAEVREVASAYSVYYALTVEKKLALHRLDIIVIEKGDRETPAVRSLKARGTVVYRDEWFTVVDLRNTQNP